MSALDLSNVAAFEEFNQSLQGLGFELRKLRRGGIVGINKEPLLNEREAAEYLGLEPSTLRRWRSQSRKQGRDQPKYTKVGRLVRYSERELKNYLERNTQK